MSACDTRLTARDLTAVDAILAVLGDWLAGAAPAAREEMRACLHRVITWPWPQDMHIAVMFCRSALRQGTAREGSQ